jgi:hypothetical protein
VVVSWKVYLDEAHFLFGDIEHGRDILEVGSDWQREEFFFFNLGMVFE